VNVVESKATGPVEAITLGFGPVGPPLMTVRVYRIGDTLIDTGQRHMAKALLARLRDDPPARVLLTHHHEDHSGNAAAISRHFGATVLAHPIAVEKLGRHFPIRLYQHCIWGKSCPVTAAPLPRRVATGRYVFRPIHTPGHSRDHTVFLEEENGWLFSGDLYLGDKIKFFRADENFVDQITSIRAILSHDFDALFCAHNPVLKGGKSRLETKLAFLEEFYGRIRDLAAAGHTRQAITRRLDPGLDRMVRLITVNNVCFANMVRSALNDLAA
jgi:endoribonuclease LACTB2